jgi:hypothetical protein
MKDSFHVSAPLLLSFSFRCVVENLFPFFSLLILHLLDLYQKKNIDFFLGRLCKYEFEYVLYNLVVAGERLGAYDFVFSLWTIASPGSTANSTTTTPGKYYKLPNPHNSFKPILIL